MMKKTKIEVQGIEIRLEKIKKQEYLSLTDIARFSDQKPAVVINSWMRNSKTLLFLETWEKVHNPKFKVSHMTDFRLKALEERYSISINNYVKETGAIGLLVKRGKYGGTYAFSEIALDFCSWLSPQFKVYLYKEFEQLKTAELEIKQKEKEFYLNKMFNNSLENAQYSKYLIDGPESLEEE